MAPVKMHLQIEAHSFLSLVAEKVTLSFDLSVFAECTCFEPRPRRLLLSATDSAVARSFTWLKTDCSSSSGSFFQLLCAKMSVATASILKTNLNH